MQKTDIPSKYLVAWANGDSSRVEVPVTTTDATRASQTLGFPPLTMQPPEAGGVPPNGEDFNGGLNQISRVARWMMAGSDFPYDGTFATATQINGYAAGATIPRADGTGYWVSTADNNTTNPDATDGSAANWLPAWVTGSASITASTTDVTVYPVTAAKQTLIISGTLTANRNIILPAWTYAWEIIDNTVRAGFTLTAKTASGSGVLLQTGSQRVRGDGTNIVQVPQSIAQAVLGTQPITLAQGNALYAPLGSGAAITGEFKNLTVSATGTNATVTVAADQVIVTNGSGANALLSAVSVTPSLAASGANGLDTGTSAASTWYSVWIIWNGTTTAGLLSLSTSAPTLPSGYTYKARIGWVRSDATANKYPLSFVQNNRRAQYKLAAGSNVTGNPPAMASVTSTTLVPIATGGFVPPTAGSIVVTAAANVNNSAIVAPNSAWSTTLASATPATTNAATGAATTSTMQVLVVLESTNIYGATTGGTANVWCMGWEDNL